MLRLGRLLLVTLIAGASAPAVATAQTFAPPQLPPGAAPAPETVPGEVVVGFTDAAGASTRARAREAVDADLTRRLGDPDVQLLDVPRGTNVRAAADALQRRPGVAFAEPNYIGRVASTTPNDLHPDQALNRIGIATAWDYRTSSVDIPTAVIDTGVDLDHADLAGHVTGADEVDPAGHGTHVAGIIGAAGNNGVGVTGVSWDASMVSYRACDAGGSCRTADVAQAINTAADAGVKVANLSIEDLPDTQGAVAAAIAHAREEGTLLVAAAGNGATSGRNVDSAPSLPCTDPSDNVICVAATIGASGSEQFAAYSNWGPVNVDLAAPGSRLPGVNNGFAGVRSTLPNDAYGNKNGTSMAAPHVAGAAALLWAQHPSATYADVRSTLLATTDPLSTLQGKTATGGRLNLSKAFDRLDATAPTTTITGGNGPTQSTSADVTWSRTEAGVSTSECRVDGGTWSTCTSPKSLTGLAVGTTHTVAVRARDRHPNVEATPKVATIAVVPTTTITDRPDQWTRATDASFTWTANESGTTFACSLDGAAFASCAPGQTTYSGLATGGHTFDVRATGAAGTEITPARYSWTIDRQAPTVQFGPDVPSDVQTTRTASVSFTANEPGSTFRCSIDGAAPEDCTSPVVRSALRDTGPDDPPYTVSVTPTDRAGNVGAPITATWTVDATAPSVTITAGPPAATRAPSGSIAFTVTAPDLDTVTCQLDDVEPTTCSGSYLFSALAEGTHAVTIRAEDDHGNVQPVTRSWIVDQTKPVIAKTGGPETYAKAGSPPFTWSVTDATSTPTTCTLDAIATPCAGNALPSDGLADGQHTLVVSEMDAAGNEATPLTLSWTLDTAAPAAPVVTGPLAGSAADQPRFTFAAGGTPTADADVVGYRCRLDAGASTACESPKSFYRLTSKPDYKLDVQAIDRAGNVGSSTSHTFAVDLPDGPTIGVGPATAKPTFVLGGSEAYECKVDAGSFASCGPTPAFTGLAAGTHTLAVRGTAPAFTDPTTRTFEVIPLALNVTARPAATTTEGDAEIVFDVAGATSVLCQVDDGVATGCSSPLRLGGLADGGHTVSIVATDNAGGRIAQSVGWTVRRPAPAPAPTPDASPVATPTASPKPSPTPKPAVAKPASTSSLVKTIVKRFRGSGPAVARLKPFSVAYKSTLRGRLKVLVQLRTGKRWTTIGGGSIRYTKAGSRRIRVTLTAKGKRTVRKVARPQLRARATFTPS